MGTVGTDKGIRMPRFSLYSEEYLFYVARKRKYQYNVESDTEM